MAKQSGAFELELTGDAVAVLAVEVPNPEGVPVIVKQATLLIDARASAAGGETLAVGVGAAGAANNNIVAAQALSGAVEGNAYSLLEPNAGGALPIWGTDQVLNATTSVAAPAFRGRLYVEYYRIDRE